MRDGFAGSQGKCPADSGGFAFAKLGIKSMFASTQEVTVYIGVGTVLAIILIVVLVVFVF